MKRRTLLGSLLAVPAAALLRRGEPVPVAPPPAAPSDRVRVADVFPDPPDHPRAKPAPSGCPKCGGMKFLHSLMSNECAGCGHQITLPTQLVAMLEESAAGLDRRPLA